jgi:uncharacterized membrane protein
MTNPYLLLKFVHILIAILALGASAVLGVALELYGSHPTHGPFLLRAIRRLVAYFVLPGYVLVLVTGLLLVRIAWPLTTRWVKEALALWVVGIAVLGCDLVVLRHQERLLEAGGPDSASYRRASLLGRGLGAGLGLVVLVILYLMVFKPGT